MEVYIMIVQSFFERPTMKINSKILSLPPHISTTWKNVTSIQLVNEGSVPLLAIILNDGHVVKIPGLAKEIIDQVFESHSLYLEGDATVEPVKQEAPSEVGPAELSKAMASMGMPFQFSVDGPAGMGPLQHNPEQASAPNMPPEVLSKITQVAHALGLDSEAATMPDAEPHCNCMHCQVIRAMKGKEPIEQEEAAEEETVSDEDLKFKEFDIEQKGKDLYEVTNPLDRTEHFQVFLGKPIGCTCGKKDCEHIKAVLNS